MSSTQGKISLNMAIILGINALVGAGIFSVPAAMQTTAGPAGLLTYAFVIMAVLFMALSFARIATLYPEAGTFYGYAKIWGGQAWGIIAMGSYLTGLMIAIGLMAKLIGIFANVYIPSVSPMTLSFIVIAFLVLANIAGAVISQIGQWILFVLTVLPLGLITALCLTKADAGNLVPFMPNGINSVMSAIKIVIFGFFGFEAIPGLFKIIQDPKKNVPKAITWTIIIVGAIYVLFTGSIIIGLPRVLFSHAGMPLSFALLSQFPRLTWLVAFIDWAIIITIMGTIHSMIWAISSMIVNTANEIKMLKGKLSNRTALLLMGAVSAICCYVFTSIDLLFELTALFIVFAYATAIMPLLLKPKGRSMYQIGIAVMGLCTAGIIFACGIFGTMKQLGF